MSDRLILGAPYYGMDESLHPWWPYKQQALFEKEWRRFSTQERVLVRIYVEHLVLATTLKEWGIPFSVIGGTERVKGERIRNLLKEELGKFWLPLPRLEQSDFQGLLYPRDLATVLPDQTILVNSKAPFGKLPRKLGQYQLRYSPFGEGGRVQLRKNVAIVPTNLVMGRCSVHPSERYLEPFYRAGVQVIRIPNNLIYMGEGLGPNRKYQIEDHLDRYLSLVEARDGSLHLIVDQTYIPYWVKDGRCQSASREIGGLEGIRSLCAQAGVEVHFLDRQPRVPLSIGMMQLADGRVLVTGREGQLSELLNRLVGRKSVYHVAGPFSMIPTYYRAGIHCLLNELPLPFLEYLQQNPRPLN